MVPSSVLRPDDLNRRNEKQDQPWTARSQIHRYSHFTVAETDISAVETDFTIRSDPFAFEQQIVDPPTALMMYNLKAPQFLEGEAAFYGVYIDGNMGDPVRAIWYGVDGPDILSVQGSKADLNQHLNITGRFLELNRIGQRDARWEPQEHRTSCCHTVSHSISS